MSQGIKFRGWDDVEKCFHYGGFAIHATAGKVVDVFPGVTISSVMQFSGLKDSKGKDIYEGDIVYIAGLGDTVIEFPFVALYEAGAEDDIGEIVGNIFKGRKEWTIGKEPE